MDSAVLTVQASAEAMDDVDSLRKKMRRKKQSGQETRQGNQDWGRTLCSPACALDHSGAQSRIHSIHLFELSLSGQKTSWVMLERSSTHAVMF